ncbi:hypothetical protein [Microseira sp. BLCC-F43]
MKSKVSDRSVVSPGMHNVSLPPFKLSLPTVKLLLPTLKRL